MVPDRKLGDNLGGFTAALIVGAVVAVAAAYVSWGWGTMSWQRADADRRAYQRAAYADEYIKRVCVGADIDVLRECIEGALSASREDRRAEYDLAAQESMARWAWWMLLSSVATVATTALGIYYVRETLRAAIDANRVSETTSIIQQRAWISFDSWNLDMNGETSPVLLNALGFRMVWSNKGITPAMNVRVFIRATPLDMAGHHDGKNESLPHIVGPGCKLECSRVWYEPSDIMGARANPLEIEVVVKYDTVFPGLKDRVSRIIFGIEYIGRGDLPEIVSGKISAENFRVSPTGEGAEMT